MESFDAVFARSRADIHPEAPGTSGIAMGISFMPVTGGIGMVDFKVHCASDPWSVCRADVPVNNRMHTNVASSIQQDDYVDSE